MRKSQNQRDARGRFIGKSGSKAAAEDARAERAEKARRKEDDERLNAESGLLKKLSKVAEGIGNPSETRAVDALGYAVAGPLWAAGKELGGISKEVGGSLNGARKSIADVIRGNDDNSRRKGFLGVNRKIVPMSFRLTPKNGRFRNFRIRPAKLKRAMTRFSAPLIR